MRIMLTLIDWEEISRGLAENLLFAEITLRIGRDPSVVSRDMARHGPPPWAVRLPGGGRGAEGVRGA